MLNARAKKRVAIARDVIAQLRMKKFTAGRGTYLDLFVDNDLFPPDVSGKREELQTLLKAPKVCEVCAIGSMFVSDVLKNDKFDNFEYDIHGQEREIIVHSEFMKERLQKYFSSKQLQIIEAVFEGEVAFMSDGYDYEKPYRFSQDEISSYGPCIDYYRDKYKNDGDRMRAIMLNIIRNNGLFVPPKHTRTVKS